MSSRPFGSGAEEKFALSRRQFVHGLAAGGALFGLGLVKPVWALKSHGQDGAGRHRIRPLDRRNTAELHWRHPYRHYREWIGAGTTAALARGRHGQSAGIQQTAGHLIHGHQTSIHWHGILLPANMDGVPGLSFDGINRGETYPYRFDVIQNGTYWYHSHSGFQEQAGVYGAIVIDPLKPEPFTYDRDYVVLLSDWTDLDPTDLFARLKKASDYDNFAKLTVGDWINDAKEQGLAATLRHRKAWGEMRMTPTDLSDVNGNTYTYLLNGTTALGNWTGIFQSGEKVRLRFINGSAMTHFDVRIPGLKMTVVAADGQYVRPVSVDEFRIATAETFDGDRGAHRPGCLHDLRAGYGPQRQRRQRQLAVREGLRAPVPAVDPKPILTMDDMGHGGMGGGGHDMSSMSGGSMENSSMEGMDHSGHDMSAMAGGAMAGMDHGAGGMQQHPASESNNPLVDMQTMAPTAKLDDPGIGLRDNGRRVLTYADLKSTFPDPDGREPGRTIELHHRPHGALRVVVRRHQVLVGRTAGAQVLGQRVRIVLVNDTMMTHPIHLHGVWSDLEDADGNFQVRKHTIDMPPGSKRSYRVRADALGRWAYHCHLLYHMEAGMFREVRIEE